MKIEVTNGPVTIIVERDFIMPQVAAAIYDALNQLVRVVATNGKSTAVTVSGDDLITTVSCSGNGQISGFAKGGVITNPNAQV